MAELRRVFASIFPTEEFNLEQGSKTTKFQEKLLEYFFTFLMVSFVQNRFVYQITHYEVTL